MRTCGTKGTLYLLILFSFLTWVGAVPVSRAQSREMSVLEKVAVYPTLIVHNGKIATMDNNLTNYQAMAIRDDRIWTLGTNREIRELAGPQTLMIDLKGRTVVPGLIDAHTHPQLWGWWAFGGQILPELEPAYARGKDIEEVKLNLRRVIQQRIQKQGKDQWVIASVPHRMSAEVQRYPQLGHLFPNYNPSGQFRREELNNMAPDTPVVIISGCCAGLANKKARELMIQELGYEPSAGPRISYDLVWGVILKGKTDKAAELARREMQEDFVNRGVTTFASHGETNTEFFSAVNKLDREGKMPMRFAWSHEAGFFGSKDPEQYYRLLGNFLGQGSDFLWNVGVGWEAWGATSGGCLSEIAKTEELQKRFEFRGRPYETCLPADSLEYRAHLAAVEAGLRLYDVHNLFGDKVLDRVFAIAEQAIKNGSRTLEDIREQGWEFDHNPLIRPDQIPLIKKYGFQMDFQGFRLARDLYNARNFYKPEYVSWVTPVKSLVDAGILFNLGTDVGINQLSNDAEDFLVNLSAPFPYRDSIWPHIGVWVQRVTEVAIGEFGSGERRTETVALGPEQRIDRISALRAATTWPAKMLLREDRLGSLEPGKLADFVVIDKDYFTIPEPEIMKLKTLMTALGGKIVYQAPNF